MSLLKLIRFPNLLIVVLTQFLLYYQVILPALQVQKITPALTQAQFFLLTLITALITAGGYIINDIIDLKIDIINKPDKIIIGRRIARQTAHWLYFCVNLAGFILSLYLAYETQQMPLLFLFPTAVTGLLLYSIVLKRRPLWGNLLVSFYCAGVAAIVWVVEAKALAQLPVIDYQKVIHLLLYYAVFAFLSTLFREIVKDLEDAQGDAAGGARTAPVVWGALFVKRIAMGTGILLLLFLAYMGYALQEIFNIWAYLFIAILASLIIIGEWRLFEATKKLHYYQLSQFSKIIMLGGILLLLFF